MLSDSVHCIQKSSCVWKHRRLKAVIQTSGFPVLGKVAVEHHDFWQHYTNVPCCRLEQTLYNIESHFYRHDFRNQLDNVRVFHTWKNSIHHLSHVWKPKLLNAIIQQSCSIGVTHKSGLPDIRQLHVWRLNAATQKSGVPDLRQLYPTVESHLQTTTSQRSYTHLAFSRLESTLYTIYAKFQNLDVWKQLCKSRAFQTWAHSVYATSATLEIATFESIYTTLAIFRLESTVFTT